MGAVQRLATVVIIGLVALATALTVYIANEPDRRDSEGGEQDVIAIERGTELYIQYCLQCHGPDGKGRNGGEGRPGAPLNQEGTDAYFVEFQTDDPSTQSLAENYLHYSITYGKPENPTVVEKAMPAFGTELNNEEINELVHLVMYGDWDYVYNQSVLHTGEALDEECAATPDLDACGDLAYTEEGEPVAYPTVPPAEGDSEEEEEAATPAEGMVAEIDATDLNQWTVTEVTAMPGDQILVKNTGNITHDITIDEWGIHEELPAGAEVVITIPEDASGTITYYCSVPGHRAAGMEGTITIQSP